MAVKSDSVHREQPQLKKISIVETNNLFYTDRYKYLYLPKSPKDPEMKKLRDFVEKRARTADLSDPDIFMSLMEWTCLQWAHDPLHEPPAGSTSLQILQLAASGQRFRCQEYAQVLHDILTAFGYVSRLLQIRKSDAAYGSPGAGHVAVEVYSNTLAKWIYLDPQWCIAAIAKQDRLNFLEMFRFRERHSFDSVQFMMSSLVMARDSVGSIEAYDSEYRSFISQYFGYEGIVANRFGGLVFLFLPLETKEQYITFQGVSVNRRIFTDREANLYFSANATVILFDYEKEVNWTEIFTRYDIKTPDDYMNSMPKFAARPDFRLHFNNNCIWFDHYEVKIDGSDWKRIRGDSYTWSLREGVNEIRVRSVNCAGVSGTETYSKIHYGPVAGSK